MLLDQGDQTGGDFLERCSEIAGTSAQEMVSKDARLQWALSSQSLNDLESAVTAPICKEPGGHLEYPFVPSFRKRC
jgi:hypothetical protein